MASWSVGGQVGPITGAPYPVWYNIPIYGPYGAFYFVAGALATPGNFSVAQGDIIQVWVCRPRR